MKTHLLGFLLFFCLSTALLGQVSFEIEGKIYDKITQAPIAYANVYNKQTQRGTISNTDGYFRIAVNGITDSVIISYIGYEDLLIPLVADTKNYRISLVESIIEVSEVVIKPKDNAYLFDLIHQIKPSFSRIKKQSKAYYELKSYVDNSQKELVEGYYNLSVEGYKLKDLHLKAGRIALRKNRNRLFASIESSRALLMFDLLGGNDYFPTNPLELSKPKLKKHFYLDLGNRYVDEANDSIYVIEYRPKDTTGRYFYGKLWINTTQHQLLKITLHCAHAQIYPFLPLFTTDKIAKVNFYLTQSFLPFNGQTFLNHIDFEYNIEYMSRVGKVEEKTYTIQTHALLYAYDYSHVFDLPFFTFAEGYIGDYRKINAFPYNSFFWAYNDEYRLKDSINTNETFFADSASYTNATLFKTNAFANKGLFERAFVYWSKNRIKLGETLPDSALKSTQTGFTSEQYHLGMKIFLDINQYKDSLHFVTATLIDPYESYYKLPMDNATHCFVNLYFDLCEIARRELEEKLATDKRDIAHAKALYQAHMAQFEAKSKAFFAAVERGNNEKEMRKYNALVYKTLGIDNIALFQPYDD